MAIGLAVSVNLVSITISSCLLAHYIYNPYIMFFLVAVLEKNSMIQITVAVIIFIFLYWLVNYFIRKLGKDPKNAIPKGIMKEVTIPLVLIFISILMRLKSFRELIHMEDHKETFMQASNLIFIFGMTWLILRILNIIKGMILSNLSVDDVDNIKVRKIYTQFNILSRIFTFIIVLVAIGLALMNFDDIKAVGKSVLASAGVAGIIVGFSAQKFIGTIFAGMQIAFAQPIKLDDVVVVEGEWGRIEEITLTYVVVKIWDKRRLIVPAPYFIEKPFENWTKTTADIFGTVFLYVDYRVPIDALRKHLKTLLADTKLWDKKLSTIQVTDAKTNHVELRILVSAKDSSSLWDLRVYVREKMITFLQENYPESIAHHRILVDEKMETVELQKEAKDEAK